MEFWQQYLAAEFQNERGRAILERLGSFSGDHGRDFWQRQQLSEGELKRMEFASALDLKEHTANGVKILEEEDYSEPLREGEAPPAIFYWGQPVFSTPTIAIVGTRAASAYGKACAHKFAEAFARAGVTVVSGGALGIDGAAHKGALQGGGKTIAVLAGGVDNVYPSVHAALFRDIRESGCLVSQFPLGSKPNAYRFLVRNGLIASLSMAVLVVEAPAKSGAISTAEAASELGRQVFVVPANIDQFSFHGSFNLIRDGATLVDNPSQVLDALSLETGPPPPELEPASDLGQKILKALTVTPLSPEFIVERTGLDTGTVLAELTLLELEGRVIRDGMGYAVRP